MPDIVDTATRSRMMSGIRSKDTKPEIAVRKGLFARGFRYRLHVKDIPGKPDMLFPCHKATIFVHGCFWHGHDCPLFKLPDTRRDFWKTKIERNQKRDKEVHRLLAEQGWRQLTIWECAIRGRTKIGLEAVIEATVTWLRSENRETEIRGGQPWR